MEAVFFDFDGVLTTDPTGSYTTCKNIARIANLPFDDVLPCYKKYGKRLNLGASHADMWPDFCRGLGADLDISILKEAFSNTPRNEGMFKLAARVHTGYKSGIITNNNKERFKLLRREWNLDELFDSLILSADVGAKKDSEIIFEKALESLGLGAKDCVFIDNKEANLAIPGKMGFKTILYDHEKSGVGALVKRLNGLGIV